MSVNCLKRAAGPEWPASQAFESAKMPQQNRCENMQNLAGCTSGAHL